MKTHLSSQSRINEAVKLLASIKPNGEYSLEIKKLPKTRTNPQNASLWLYLKNLAEELNNAGYEMVVKIVNKEVHIPWDKDSLKRVVWDGIMLKMFNKKSSTELTRSEISEVYEVMNRFTSNSFGVGLQWPNKDYREVKR